MAIQSIIRKSISNAAPLATRVIGASRPIHYPSATTIAFSALKCTRTATLAPRVTCTRPYSYGRQLFHGSKDAEHDGASSDNELLEVVQSEIECAELKQKNLDFPDTFPFSVENVYGEHTVILRREYKDELITVKVSMPELDEDEDDNDDDDYNYKDDNARSDLGVPFVVKVTKKSGNGRSLEFQCMAFPDEFRIDELWRQNPDDVHLAYEDPDFSKLDERLQKAFHKYLERRGLKPMKTNFLREYMIEKDIKEHISWLKNVKKFVQP